MKNTVYVLQSFAKKIENPTQSSDFQKEGFLLFKSLEKANAFLEICENLNRKKLLSYYEKLGFVEVEENIFEKVQKSSSFYVISLNNKPILDNISENKETEQ